jgi:hypothetical protein
MAERFVYGFVVSLDALWGLVGSQLDADELLVGVDDEFTEMFDDEFDSGPSLTESVRDVLTGHLVESRAYPYVRVVEPILTLVAEPLGMIHVASTYYLPNDSFGRWNPVLEALGLVHVAQVWGRANCAFPWPRGRSPLLDWPCVTELGPPILAEVSTELAGDWPARLSELPDSVLADDGDAALAADVRTELGDGIAQLARWAARAADTPASRRRCVGPKDNSLVLVMDGGQ